MNRVPPPDLRARVLQAAQREPSPTLGDARKRRALSLALGFVPLAAIYAALGGVTLGARPPGYVVLLAIAWAVLAIVGSWGAIGRGRSMGGRPSSWLAAIVVVTPLALGLVAMGGYLFFPEAADVHCPPVKHAACFALHTALASGPLLGFAIARRRSDPVHPRLTGAALGVAAGAWGALAIATHCPFSEPLHMVLGHILPIVLLGGLGAWLGAKSVAISSRT